MFNEILDRPEIDSPDASLEMARTVSPLFTSDEIRQFDADDMEAGRRIGKILTALFIYTLIAMSVVIVWTLRTVGF